MLQAIFQLTATLAHSAEHSIKNICFKTQTVRHQAKCFYDDPFTKVLFMVLSIQRPHSNFPALMH